MTVAAALLRVRDEIAAASERSGRADVRLIAISKSAAAESVYEAYLAGQRIFGENRVQEGARKIEELQSAMPAAEWHLVGHLQSNKARQAARLFDVIQSLDSEVLAIRLNNLAASAGLRLPVLAEVNVTGELSKAGFSVADFKAALPRILSLEHLDWRGLMTIPPLGADAEDSRWVFRALRELRDGIRDSPRGEMVTELSMGMSADFPVAIEEGATMVRIGTAIFGERVAGRGAG